MNDFCEFPRKIDMRKYTQGYLKAKDKQKQEEMDGDIRENEVKLNFKSYFK